RTFLSEDDVPLPIRQALQSTWMHIELAVVEVHSILVDIFNAEGVHHFGACRNGLGKILLAMAVCANRTTACNPIAHVDVVNGILDDEVSRQLDILVPSRARAFTLWRNRPAMPLCLYHERLADAVKFVNLPDGLAHYRKVSQMLYD